ncbi:MAG: ORF6N domain-containing protein, partial [Burkholderiales bacterium]
MLIVIITTLRIHGSTLHLLDEHDSALILTQHLCAAMAKKPTSSKTAAALVSIEGIEERIYVIRGRKVMLDSDLAELYGVETRSLNQAV